VDAVADVVVIGDALIDEFEHDGQAVEAVGGAALNVALGIRILKRRSALIAMVGDDEAGDAIARHVREADVALLRTDAPYGTARAVSTRVGGEPTYVFNEAAQKRRVEFDRDALLLVRTASIVAVSCLALDNDAQVDDLLTVVTDPERRLVLDPNPRPGMMNNLPLFAANLRRIAAVSLLVKVSDEDAALLGYLDLESLAEDLLTSGARYVLGTAGAQGATLYGDGLEVSVPIAHLDTPIVDTMGAGDSVLATTVAALLGGIPEDEDDWQEILERAMSVAAATCRVAGPTLQLPRG
jgi:fructokinase